MPVIELGLSTVGAGPELDFESAAAFMQTFAPVVDAALKRKIN